MGVGWEGIRVCMLGWLRNGSHAVSTIIGKLGILIEFHETLNTGVSLPVFIHVCKTNPIGEWYNCLLIL